MIQRIIFATSFIISAHAFSPPATSSSLSALFFAASTETIYVGGGGAVVDMNQYNIPLEEAAEQWTAELTAGTSLVKEGVYLGTKKASNLFVDTLSFDVKRDGGLGIELLEIAGGREDGLGITIASGLVEGGNAENSGILPGDSIVSLQVEKSTSTEALSENIDVTTISTECLSYDSTIDAILSLPSPENSDETVRVTVKRIRRQPKVRVTLQYPPEQNEPDGVIELFAGENLRRAMLTRGVKLNDGLSERFDSGGKGDCGAEGTCATCVVSISKGSELLSPPKTQEQQMIISRKPRWRMACKAVVGWGMQEGDMTIKVNPRQWAE